MIVSHKYKFVFMRPMKVASSSVEFNLAKQCGKDDMIAKIDEYENNKSYFKYSIPRNSHTLGPHASPQDIKDKIGSKAWKKYYKIAIVRNPYDMLVSRFWWNFNRNEIQKQTGQISRHAKKQLKQKRVKRTKLLNPLVILRFLYRYYLGLKYKTPTNFKEFVKNLPPTFAFPEIYNYQYWFDFLGRPIADYYIRFENLEEDYKAVCKKIGIPIEPLPRFKTDSRKSMAHYSEYYDEETKKLVYKKFKKEIDYFGYKFQKN